MDDRRYIRNTAVLFASMAVTKVIGALFKIPLANLLGGTGMGYFSTAYGLYSPIFAITAAGVPNVIMRVTAQCRAAGDLPRAAAIKRTALLLFTAVGVLGSLATAVCAAPFAEYVACSPPSTAAILCISPAVAFCCAASVIRGYYEGMSDVLPTAAASVAEAASRAVFGLGIAFAVICSAKSLFLRGKPVFGRICSTFEEAHAAALPFAAAGAVLAVSISELVGLVALIAADRRRKRGAPLAFPKKYSRRAVCAQLLRETAPIAASALVMNCVSFVDLLTVTRTLTAAAERSPELFLRRFADVLPHCGGLSGLANFMYGSYTGIAMSLFMLIPSFAGMAEKTSAPEIAAAWQRRDNDALRRGVFTLFRAGAVIACPACFGAAALARPIMALLYPSRGAETAVCLDAFVALCLGGVFMVMSSALFGVFQAIGKAHIPLLLMICSVAIKAALNPLLLRVPRLNIAGAALASVAGYVFMTAAGVLLLRKSIGGRTGALAAAVPPALCGIACAVGARAAYELTERRLGNTASVVISVAFGALIYAILLIITGIFSTNGIIKRKNAKKFKKTLAK